MRFLDTAHFNIPKPIKDANSDSSLFNTNECLSDDNSPQKSNTPFTSNYDFATRSSNDSSNINLHDNSLSKQIIKTPQTEIPVDGSRHPSRDQSNLLPPPIDRTTKTKINQK